MKSKYFSNDFDNKKQDFLGNTGQLSKPLSALVSKVSHGVSADVNPLKNQESLLCSSFIGDILIKP
jgi:hypothetical protein